MTLRHRTHFACAALAAFAIGCLDTGAGQDAAITFDATFPDGWPDGGVRSNVGARCDDDDDCRGPAGWCYGDLDGYCTELCDVDEDCPAGSICSQVSGWTSICLALCDPAQPGQCPPGNGCTSGQLFTPVCLPGCEDDTDCADGLTCLKGAGSFGAGVCIEPNAQLGGACGSAADCPTGTECIIDLDHPGGACVLRGCDEDANTACPGDAHCVPDGFFGGVCWDGCATDDDCRRDWQCIEAVPGRRVCLPRFDPDRYGQICSAGRGSCAGGTCFTETYYGFPDSYCAGPECDPDAEDPGCPGDGVCASTTGGGGICVDGCVDDSDCRTAYRCRPVDRENPSRGSACFPGCTDNSQCTATTRGGTRYVCNPGTGYCDRPFDPDDLGSACVDDSECRGGRCMTEIEKGWPAGTCTYPGCSLTGATTPAATCPAGSVCTDDGGGDPDLGVCARACTVGASTCRPGYECVALVPGETAGVCRPRCTEETCVAGTTCNDETGLCERSAED